MSSKTCILSFFYLLCNMLPQITTFNFPNSLSVTEVIWLADARQVWLFHAENKMIGVEVDEKIAMNKIIELAIDKTKFKSPQSF